MLVLSRKPNERIVITAPNGDTIVVTLADVRPAEQRAKIGIDAPTEYKIVRVELIVPHNDGPETVDHHSV